MTENFAQLFEESLKTIETRPGAIVKGTVVAVQKDVVLVDAGLKSEAAIPVEQFKNAAGEIEVNVGDLIDVALDAVEDGFGETLLSREKAKRHEAWIRLEKLVKTKLLLSVLSLVKLKVASQLKLTVFVHSCLVHW